MKTALREATELAHPMRIEDVSIDDYDAVFYPGGWGPMEDLPDNAESGRLLTDWLASGKPRGPGLPRPRGAAGHHRTRRDVPVRRLPPDRPHQRRGEARTASRTARSGCCRTGSSTIWARTTARASRSPRTSRSTAPSSPARTRARPSRWPRNSSKPSADRQILTSDPLDR